MPVSWNVVRVCRVATEISWLGLGLSLSFGYWLSRSLVEAVMSVYADVRVSWSMMAVPVTPVSVRWSVVRVCRVATEISWLGLGLCLSFGCWLSRSLVDTVMSVYADVRVSWGMVAVPVTPVSVRWSMVRV
jgi:hypothetical protein